MLGVEADADVALPFVWLSAVLLPFVESLGAGVDDGCGVDVEAADVPFAPGVDAGLDWPAP